MRVSVRSIISSHASVEQLDISNLAQVGGAKIFSKLDVNSGLWQVRLARPTHNILNPVQKAHEQCSQAYKFWPASFTYSAMFANYHLGLFSHRQLNANVL